MGIVLNKTFKRKNFWGKQIEKIEPVRLGPWNLFKDKGSYDSEKEKVDGDIEQAQLASKDIEGQAGELDKAGEDVGKANKGLADGSDGLGNEEKGLKKDREEKKDEKEDKSTVESEVESNEKISAEFPFLTEPPYKTGMFLILKLLFIVCLILK